jgi:hypothetical protein
MLSCFENWIPACAGMTKLYHQGFGTSKRLPGTARQINENPENAHSSFRHIKGNGFSRREHFASMSIRETA